ncbi:unnamed protein product [Moneuplotes crassus]|uniref:Potassium channel domain-containing protein n=1 Tax=Euplotes crassus TaxID=5936 RepID=A0AAD1YAZ4_EUPCR|nr:unnamed protein product [Moneuplotes crassus]
MESAGVLPSLGGAVQSNANLLEESKEIRVLPKSGTCKFDHSHTSVETEMIMINDPKEIENIRVDFRTTAVDESSYRDVQYKKRMQALQAQFKGTVPGKGLMSNNVNKCYNSYMCSNYISFILAYLGIALCVMENEFYIKEPNDKEDRYALLTINFVINFLLAINITFGFKLWVQFTNLLHPILQLGISESQEEFQQKNLKMRLLERPIFLCYISEIILCFVTPYQWIYEEEYSYTSEDQEVRFYINTLLLALMIIFRTYHLIRALLQFSIFMTARSERMTRIFSPDSNLVQSQLHPYIFAFRCEFKYNSFRVIVICLTYITLMFGMMFRLVEEPYSMQVSQPTFSYQNSFWVCFITMSTVGYGEFYPVSVPGKLVSTFCAFMGVFLQASSVIAMLNLLEMTTSEIFSYKLLKILEMKEKVLHKATRMLQTGFRKKKNKSTKKKERKLDIRWRKKCREFKMTTRSLWAARCENVSKMDQSSFDLAYYRSQLFKSVVLSKKLKEFVLASNKKMEKQPKPIIKVRTHRSKKRVCLVVDKEADNPMFLTKDERRPPPLEREESESISLEHQKTASMSQIKEDRAPFIPEIKERKPIFLKRQCRKSFEPKPIDLEPISLTDIKCEFFWQKKWAKMQEDFTLMDEEKTSNRHNSSKGRKVNLTEP